MKNYINKIKKTIAFIICFNFISDSYAMHFKSAAREKLEEDKSKLLPILCAKKTLIFSLTEQPSNYNQPSDKKKSDETSNNSKNKRKSKSLSPKKNKNSKNSTIEPKKSKKLKPSFGHEDLQSLDSSEPKKTEKLDLILDPLVKTALIAKKRISQKENQSSENKQYKTRKPILRKNKTESKMKQNLAHEIIIEERLPELQFKKTQPVIPKLPLKEKGLNVLEESCNKFYSNTDRQHYSYNSETSSLKDKEAKNDSENSEELNNFLTDTTSSKDSYDQKKEPEKILPALKRQNNQQKNLEIESFPWKNHNENNVKRELEDISSNPSSLHGSLTPVPSNLDPESLDLELYFDGESQTLKFSCQNNEFNNNCKFISYNENKPFHLPKIGAKVSKNDIIEFEDNSLEFE